MQLDSPAQEQYRQAEKYTGVIKRQAWNNWWQGELEVIQEIVKGSYAISWISKHKKETGMVKRQAWNNCWQGELELIEEMMKCKLYLEYLSKKETGTQK